MTVLRTSVGVPSMGFSPGQPALLCMAQRGGAPTAPTFLQRVRRDLASRDAGIFNAIVREITEVSHADIPALELEEYGALAVVLREGWGRSDGWLQSESIKAYTALVAHHRISADECRKALTLVTRYFSTAPVDFFVAMLREVSWEPAIIELLIRRVRDRDVEYCGEFVPFLQVIHEKYPSAANGWASAALSFASRWGYSRGETGFVEGKFFTNYLCTTTTPSDDGLWDMAWRRMEFVKLCKDVGALPAAIRNVRPLSCDKWDATVRTQALRRLLLCPEDLTIAEATYICDHLDADDRYNNTGSSPNRVGKFEGFAVLKAA